LPQPHWQFVSWQRHSFAGQLQEQFTHGRLAFAVFFAVTFFTFDIFFSPFSARLFLNLKRFQRG
jgi:hypothetical protein